MSQVSQIPPFVRRQYWKRNGGSAGGPGPGSMGWGCSVCVLHRLGEKTQWRRINCCAMGKERPAIKIIWDDCSLDQCSGVHLQLHSLLLNDRLVPQGTGQQAQPCLYGSKDASRSLWRHGRKSYGLNLSFSGSPEHEPSDEGHQGPVSHSSSSRAPRACWGNQPAGRDVIDGSAGDLEHRPPKACIFPRVDQNLIISVRVAIY